MSEKLVVGPLAEGNGLTTVCPHMQGDGSMVRWNPDSRVVACHGCGRIFIPIPEPLGAEYLAWARAAWPDMLMPMEASA